MANQCWKVVGGGDKGGILVREGKDTKSAELKDRLATGALVEQLELQGDRLCYKKLSDDIGPETGWVSTKLKGKDLLQKVTTEESTATTEAAKTEKEEDLPVVVEEEPEMEPPAKYGGGTLPKIPRGETLAFPTFNDLPESRRKMLMKQYEKKKDKREPRIRLFVFYGVADSVSDWAEFMVHAPVWVDIAVYECKCHGVRETEPWDASMETRLEDAWEAIQPALEQHAKGGSIEGAPFAFLVHSAGSQLVTLLARRVRHKLNLEPSDLIVLDRPPPNIRAISDVGYRMLCEDPKKFFDHFNPNIVGYMKTMDTNKLSARFVDKWQKGMHITQEHRCRESYHMFRCPIYAFVATEAHGIDETFRAGKMDEQQKEQHVKRALVTQSVPDSRADWDKDQYDLWSKWTTGGCEVKHILTDHSSLRFHDEAQDVIWAILKARAFT